MPIVTENGVAKFAGRAQGKPCNCAKDQPSPVPEQFIHMGICRVCWRINGDGSHKMVMFCETCNQFICARCWNDWPRRIAAAGMEKLAEFKGAT